ncbi:MAG: class A beta-lactamase [Paraprevotella sp.]|nr:class A beta-lactamase [Paraprevotella sp.]
MIYGKILAGLYSVAIAVVMFPATSHAQGEALETVLDKYVRTHEAEIGIAVITDRHDTVCVNNNRRYPMNSVMKLYQAMAVANAMQRRGHRLDSVIAVRQNEMAGDTYSPMRDRYPSGDIHISVGDLLKYSLQQSDNNACDILFRHIISVAETDNYIRSLGVDGFSIAADEADMHADTSRVSDNWTRPLTAALLINRLFTEQLYDNEYWLFLLKTLNGCTTGASRLAKPFLSTNVVIGHKTGTGFPSADGHPQGINDVGFVRLPDGRCYSVAVFVKSSRYDMAETERMIAEISEIVWRNVSVPF